jgi:hypothetical protein
MEIKKMFKGIALIVIAIGIYMWLEDRVMSRMSRGGVEMFNSYKDVWKARLIEIPAKIIMIVSAFSGVILLLK